MRRYGAPAARRSPARSAKRAQPFEDTENEGALDDPRRPRCGGRKGADGDEGGGDEREMSRAQEVRAQDEQSESRRQEAEGHAG